MVLSCMEIVSFRHSFSVGSVMERIVSSVNMKASLTLSMDTCFIAVDIDDKSFVLSLYDFEETVRGRL